MASQDIEDLLSFPIHKDVLLRELEEAKVRLLAQDRKESLKRSIREVEELQKELHFYLSDLKRWSR